MSEHVAQLVQQRDAAAGWLKWAGYKRCCKCGERGEYPWTLRGNTALICDRCHPVCEEPGCRNPMLLGGEGGCEQHEHLFWEGFQDLLSKAEVA